MEGGHRLQCVPVSEDGRNKIFVVVTMRGEGQLKVFDNRKLAEACALKENGDVRYTFWSETPAMHGAGLSGVWRLGAVSGGGLLPGATVKLHSLRSSKELNRLTGVLQGYDAEKGRWATKLFATGRTIYVKPGNLKLYQADKESSSSWSAARAKVAARSKSGECGMIVLDHQCYQRPLSATENFDVVGKPSSVCVVWLNQCHCISRVASVYAGDDGQSSSIDMYNNDVGQESAQKFMKQTGDLKAATLYFAS